MVQISCCILGVVDAFESQFCNQAILKGAVDSFRPASRLGGMCEDQPNPQFSHGSFKLGWFLGILRDVEATVAGGGKLGGTIKVERCREAVSSEHFQADTEAPVQVFFLLEETIKRVPCGIVGAEDQG